MPMKQQHDAVQKQQRRQAMTPNDTNSSVAQRAHTQEAPSYMDAFRERCATSKNSITISKFQAMLNEEIISASFAKQQGERTAKADQQQATRSTPSEITFEPVRCTEGPQNTTTSVESRVPKHNNSNNEQSHVSKSWLPRLPSFRVWKFPRWAKTHPEIP